ncbi:MAG: ATP-binding cassette domain-containing protein [Alphaproteobacteria bacterium]
MLQIQNLKAGYNGNAVVDIAAFSLDPGEHCMILGKSGAGKTTLLYALAGLLSPISGSIHAGDIEITKLNKATLDAFRGKNIGIIYQTLHMVGALSVLENLLLVQYAAGMAQDVRQAEKLLAQLELNDYRHRKPETLSQGQQQRVAIACAAMNNPKIILGDEPTSALDDEACKVVMQLLLNIAKESNASLIIATHDARIKKHFQKFIMLGDLQ